MTANPSLPSEGYGMKAEWSSLK